MDEEVQMIIDDAKERMQKTIAHLDNVLAKLRAGRASVNLLDDVKVDYYGTITPLSQIANVSVPDAQTIRVQPWEKTMIAPIEKAILIANLGFNPSNNGEAIIIAVPPLTEERRIDLVKQAKAEGEDAKVSIRNARRDANEEFKKMKKDGLPEDEEKKATDIIQDLTTQYNKIVEERIDAKEIDIMKV